MLETARNPDGSIKFSFFGIFDGHGGSEASEFVRAHLLKNIIVCCSFVCSLENQMSFQSNSLFESDDDNDILEAIRQGFLETHDKMSAVVGRKYPQSSMFRAMIELLVTRLSGTRES